MDQHPVPLLTELMVVFGWAGAINMPVLTDLAWGRSVTALARWEQENLLDNPSSEMRAAL